MFAKMRAQSRQRLCAQCGRQIKGQVRKQECGSCHGDFIDAITARAQRTPDGCWLYVGTLDKHGYGVLVTSTQRLAHRAVHEALIGPIPKGMDVDHLCHTPEACAGGSSCPHRRCINPAHLSAKTRRDNWLRGSSITARNLAKTHCPQGHEFSPENTAVCTRPDGRTWRRCRTCHRARNARKKK
jgi:hypothetical protein